MARCTPAISYYLLKSEVSITLPCQLCSTCYTALRINNCPHILHQKKEMTLHTPAINYHLIIITLNVMITMTLVHFIFIVLIVSHHHIHLYGGVILKNIGLQINKLAEWIKQSRYRPQFEQFVFHKTLCT